ncbi:MAG TPA: tetratricopeptide repeat protein [Gemmataceae bacterium]|nr:tetratricopeptide repeat protein [Gemmataceae bacterium]
MTTKADTLALAMQHHRAGQLQQAEDLYRTILQVGSSDPNVWCYLGTAQLGLGKPVEAETSYRRALELRPHLAEAYGDLGIALAQQGRLAEAATTFQQGIRLRPEYPEAYCNLGVVLNQLGRPAEAVACLEEALRLRPDYAEAYNNLGTVYQSRSSLAEAIACYRRALELQPQNAQARQNLDGALASARMTPGAPLAPPPVIPAEADPARAHNVRGINLAQGGKWEEAEASFREAVRLRPNYTDALNNLGNVLYFQKKLDEAVACYEEVVRLAPDHAGAYSNLAEVVRKQDRLKDALTYAERAVQLRPDFAQARVHLGLALSANERYEEALPHLEEALRLQPNLADAHHGLGYALLQLRRVGEAVASFQTALRLKPDLAEAHSNLGAALMRQGQLDDALACFREALRLKPGFIEPYLHRAHCLWQMGQFEQGEAAAREALGLEPDSAAAHNVLGVVHMKAGKPAEAVADFRRALALEPDFAQAHFNLGLAYLLQGDYEHGWPEYDWRWRCRDFVPQPLKEERGWDGSLLAGRTILLHAEQGLGDALQFIRFVPQVKRQGGAVIVACAAGLIPLLSRCAGIDQLVDYRQHAVTFDVEAPLLSLPGKLGATLDTVPAEVPYLFGDAAREEHWREELRRRPGFKIGIAWQGNRDHPEDRFRSVPLSRFAPLAREGVQLISLQLGAGREQIDDLGGQFSVAELAPRSQESSWTFLDDAAVMKGLDLVVAVDTAVAHLAGGLGVPVWIALAFAPDWRWLLHREDSPWYPSMRLFRQTRFGEWDDVFERMGDELSKLLAQRGLV